MSAKNVSWPDHRSCSELPRSTLTVHSLFWRVGTYTGPESAIPGRDEQNFGKPPIQAILPEPETAAACNMLPISGKDNPLLSVQLFIRSFGTAALFDNVKSGNMGRMRGELKRQAVLPALRSGPSVSHDVRGIGSLHTPAFAPASRRSRPTSPRSPSLPATAPIPRPPAPETPD